jgi:hypothetical protein
MLTAILLSAAIASGNEIPKGCTDGCYTFTASYHIKNTECWPGKYVEWTFKLGWYTDAACCDQFIETVEVGWGTNPLDFPPNWEDDWAWELFAEDLYVESSNVTYTQENPQYEWVIIYHPRIWNHSTEGFPLMPILRWYTGFRLARNDGSVFYTDPETIRWPSGAFLELPWMECGEECGACTADLNGDNTVDIQDFLLLMADFDCYGGIEAYLYMLATWGNCPYT